MWYIKKFGQLTVYQLQEIYTLRIKVFIVEQACAYQEVDDMDIMSVHIFKKENDKIIAYARLIPYKDKVHLGRVVVHPEYRHLGYAKELLLQILHYYEESYTGFPLHAQAQAHLQDFYNSFDFQSVSGVYLEDGIPHVDMIRMGGNINE